MGRTERSQGLAPPAVRKDLRAKQARYIINRTVPALLASNERALNGVDNPDLIVDPGVVIAVEEKRSSKDDEAGGEDAGYVKRKGQGRRKVKVGDDEEDGGKGKGKGKGKKRNDSLEEGWSNLSLKAVVQISKQRSIRIVTTDTLTAAHMLTHSSLYNDAKPRSTKSNKKNGNVCILNMASPLRPGGGVLTGATSQEEFLCSRTTLLPSLKESFYRLPELGGIFTFDVLVFRSSLSLSDSKGELPVSERWFVDVISAGMLRFPELEGGEEEVKKLGKKDRETVEGKIRAVLRIAQRKSVKKLVLGAWGCGAYGNPIQDIAAAFKKVLSGSPPSSGGGKKERKEEVETWSNLEEVIFAIGNRKMANSFAQAFGGVDVEAGPGAGDEKDEECEEDKVAEELRTKIQEMEGQLGSGRVWNPELKSRMGSILDGLKAQLREREGTPDVSTHDGEDEESSEEELFEESGEVGDGDEEDVRSYGSSE
jgi:uncharacterized protein (TIGR02452 family)